MFNSVGIPQFGVDTEILLIPSCFVFFFFLFEACIAFFFFVSWEQRQIQNHPWSLPGVPSKNQAGPENQAHVCG